MSKKKQKWSFVDLDDKDFETIEKEKQEKEEFNTNITLHDLKTEKQKDQNENWKQETNLTEEDFKPLQEVERKPERKINYEVNYDDILYEDDKKSQIAKELFSEDKPKLPNVYIDENGEKNYRNLKPRQTTKTYNQALQNQEEQIKAIHSFQENKVKELLTIKEKLDVKTNIYLKSSIVIKLKELEERTNESRSSIINKLIEIALKNME